MSHVIYKCDCISRDRVGKVYTDTHTHKDGRCTRCGHYAVAVLTAQPPKMRHTKGLRRREAKAHTGANHEG